MITMIGIGSEVKSRLRRTVKHDLMPKNESLVSFPLQGHPWQSEIK